MSAHGLFFLLFFASMISRLLRFVYTLGSIKLQHFSSCLQSFTHFTPHRAVLYHILRRPNNRACTLKPQPCDFRIAPEIGKLRGQDTIGGIECGVVAGLYLEHIL